MRPRPELALIVAVGLATTACGGGATSSTATPRTASTTTASPPMEAQSRSVSAAPFDGQIVFSDFTKPHDQIYIKPVDGSVARRLVISNFDDLAPSFSPDGRRVIFSRQGDPTLAHAGIFIVNVDGSDLHQVVPDNCPSRCGDSVEGHAWSPHGAHIVFTRALFDPTGDAPFNVGLWVMNADGSGAHQVTLKGLTCRNVCPGGAQDDQAGWSPDGKRIVFLHDEYTTAERYAIFTIAADSSDPRQVTPWKLDGADPDWSPDGTLIAFESPGEAYDKKGEQNIFSIHPDGTGLLQLTDHLSTYDAGWEHTNHPSWSPDGGHILFTHAPSDSQGASDIFVMNADGNAIHVLAVTNLIENQPFWGRSPTP